MQQVLDAPRVIEDAATCISFLPGEQALRCVACSRLYRQSSIEILREHNNGRCFCTGQRFEETVIGGFDGHNR